MRMMTVEILMKRRMMSTNQNLVKFRPIRETRSKYTTGENSLTGTIFDSSFERGDPIDFELGSGQVIKGWDQGLVGMCVDKKRKLKIPAKLGYGDQGSPPTIPGCKSKRGTRH
ncbi:FK506-binding protein 2 [Linum grandiflorum]